MNPLMRQATCRLGSNEAPRRFNRTERIEIIVSTACKANELLRFVRKREQTLSEHDGNGKVVGAMHHQ